MIDGVRNWLMAVIAASAIRLLVEEVSPGVQTKVDFFLKNGFPIRGDK